MAVQQMNFVKRWALRDFGYSMDAIREITLENKDVTHDLVTVLGLVTDKKTEVSQLDPEKTNIRFVGQFEVQDLRTGNKVNALQAFFPGDAEAFVEAFKGSAEGAVRVAFVISVRHDKGASGKPNVAGYKFGVKPFVEKGESTDIFAEFRSLLPAPQVKPAENGEVAGTAPTGAKGKKN